MSAIDLILKRVRADDPDVRRDQLKISHPGVDDNGLWFFSRAAIPGDVQVESTTGLCPFLVEGRGRLIGRTVEETAAAIVAWLRPA